MAGRLRDKVALISGTAGGQGRRAAIHFAAEGAKIVGCDVKVAEAEETVAMVRAAGGEMVSLQPVDLTDESGVEATSTSSTTMRRSRRRRTARTCRVPTGIGTSRTS